MPKILVIREFDKFSELLAGNNFEVVNLLLIQTMPIENFGELDKRLENIESYDGLFLTSPKAAEVFLQRLANKDLTFHGKVFVLGNRTKTLFEKTNFEIVFREDANTAEDFINSFEPAELAGKKFLFVRGDKSLRTIPELLKDIAAIDEIVVYRTIENKVDAEMFGEINADLQHQKINSICFFSPSGVESFANIFGTDALNNVKISVIGATTAKKAFEKNLQIDFIAGKATAEDFAVELIEYLRNGKRKIENGK